jgi:DNA helicase-2/ATP-dependent DNA helicase PcrA
MKQRFASMFGEQYANAMEFRTINGISSKIIDFYSRNHGKRQAFDLLENDGEAAKIVGQIYQKLNKEYPTESTIKDIRTGITYIKNMMLTNEEIEKLDVGVENMPEIYRQYCNNLKRKGLMDYDDQMSYALTILNSYPTVLDYFQDKFRYICVDESQDTSKIQHAIIKLLAQKYGNIFMVGDEDQSIYGFRAAYPEALMNFGNDYPNAKVLLMEQNYRSTEEIVAVANAFVSKNRFRYEKTIQATRGAGLLIQTISAADRTAQYKYLFAVAQDCSEETAVLYRNNDSTLPLIDIFERNGIPYNCKKFDNVFFSHRIINDITDIINFAYSPNDEQTFMRIYYKFGSPISKNAAAYACEQSRRSGKTILEELIRFPEMKNYAKDAAIDLLMMFPEIPKDNAEAAINRIWNGMRYGRYAEDNKLDAGKVSILCILSKNEPSAMDLLRRLRELKDIVQNHQNRSETKFLLSTVHSSKGLEYDRVLLLDIFDSTLPSKTAPEATTPDEVRQYEEDRRLYYVAMTRAKNELYLFVCTDKPSSFTAEILRTLPREIIDANDVFAFLKQNLCGKTYTDKTSSKGIIIAQRGDSVLVEYENKKLQLMTMAQMLDNRDTTVKYTEPTEDEGKSKTPIFQSSVQLSTLEAEKIAALATTGCKVYHRSFGKGVISDIAGDIISVRFDEMDESKKFGLSICVKNGLLKFTL